MRKEKIMIRSTFIASMSNHKMEMAAICGHGKSLWDVDLSQDDADFMVANVDARKTVQ